MILCTKIREILQSDLAYCPIKAMHYAMSDFMHKLAGTVLVPNFHHALVDIMHSYIFHY